MTILEQALTALLKAKIKEPLEMTINTLIYAMETGDAADIAFAENVVEAEIENLKETK